ncbi:MAG: hypothetical protein LPK13_01165 [Marinobacter sp.]|uniref:hypothetical protein n=1 Tax=Marinobacter sp. TaxID=50741 RepID=UPI0029C5CD3C|nr:hypothetical protein [Marinobacter sp.]MDX5334678.1 hypothetical protein [Marinobacter sp.]MDX5385221.1 hypothetical protein [Marinobacter sp.]MDX5441658.1 hypothetical protein [Alteromonadaceae bacterium]MDX5470924.1 hypothetical protein [Marinobacter sp.]
MTDVTESQRDGVWAHPYQLASGQTQQHELGYTRLWVTLLDMEWQVRVQKLVPDTDPITWYETIGHTLPSGAISEQRFVRTGDNGMLRYIPAMAPLPTVIKPHQPLTIPAGATCVIYVGTTLWMKICVGDSASELMELPLATPSMTWLGRNTMQGELCYASATYGRLALEAVPKRPWRALTPVTIINRRQKSLLVERFSLPTPLLPVYRNDKGRLWTPGVMVESDTDMNSASLHIESSVTAVAGPCELIAPAREQMARGRRLVRAFDHIFG